MGIWPGSCQGILKLPAVKVRPLLEAVNRANGIEANRKELESVMRYTYEQGLVKNLGKFNDMFHPGTMSILG